MNFFQTFFENIALLNPKGIIAFKEERLMMIAILLMLVIVIPVFIATFIIVLKYRAGKSSAYEPEWDRDKLIEGIWWGIPCAIILALSIITWQSSHDLDPYKPIASAANVKPITIQVVALDWKWLFIYPAQHIATVNYVEFPAGTPVNFELTSDAPMNSFFIPQLGSQMYAMPGMSTELHLEAFASGTYKGLSANISGAGFAGMDFQAKSVSETDFEQWLATAKQSTHTLTLAEYDKLAEASENNPQVTYSSVEPNLYTDEIMKYMMAPSTEATSTPDTNMNMQNMQGM